MSLFATKSPARLSSPGATENHRRAVILAGQTVFYEVRRSARRSLALRVDAQGVRVSVPQGTHVAQIDRFVEGHADWVLKRLAAIEELAQVQRFDPMDGAVFPLLGRPCVLQLVPFRMTSEWVEDAERRAVLRVSALSDPSVQLIQALRQRAIDWFAQRVAFYAAQAGVAMPHVRLSTARTRWGSCSRRSGIRLHWRLIHMPAHLIDYVVAHEVAHLHEMNHSPRFWAVVASLYPDWKAARRDLSAAAAKLPVIA